MVGIQRTLGARLAADVGRHDLRVRVVVRRRRRDARDRHAGHQHHLHRDLPASAPSRVGIGLLGTYFDNIELHGRHRHAARSHRELRLGRRARPSPASAPTPSACAGRARCGPRCRAPRRSTRPATTASASSSTTSSWSTTGPTTRRPRTAAPSRSPPGQKYDVRMEIVRERRPGGGAAPLVRRPGLAKEVIPQTHLHPVRAAGDGLDHARTPATPRCATACTATGLTPSCRTAPRPRPPTPPARRWCSSPRHRTSARRQHQVPHGGEARPHLGVGAVGRPRHDRHRVGHRLRDAVRPDAGRRSSTPPIRWRPASSGTVTVTSCAAIFTWGVPTRTRSLVARPVGQHHARAAIFGYEKGSGHAGPRGARDGASGFFLEDATAASLTHAGPGAVRRRDEVGDGPVAASVHTRSRAWTRC